MHGVSVTDMRSVKHTLTIQFNRNTCTPAYLCSYPIRWRQHIAKMLRSLIRQCPHQTSECGFKTAFLLIMVAKSDYSSYYRLPASSDLLHLINKAFQSADQMFRFVLSCKTLQIVWVKIPADPDFLKYTNEPTTYQEPCHNQDHRDHTFPLIRIFNLNIDCISKSTCKEVTGTEAPDLYMYVPHWADWIPA